MDARKRKNNKTSPTITQIQKHNKEPGKLPEGTPLRDETIQGAVI